MPYKCTLILFKLDNFLFPLFSIRNHMEKLNIIIPLNHLSYFCSSRPFQLLLSEKLCQLQFRFPLGITVSHIKNVGLSFYIKFGNEIEEPRFFCFVDATL